MNKTVKITAEAKDNFEADRLRYIKKHDKIVTFIEYMTILAEALKKIDL